MLFKLCVESNPRSSRALGLHSLSHCMLRLITKMVEFKSEKKSLIQREIFTLSIKIEIKTFTNLFMKFKKKEKKFFFFRPFNLFHQRH